MKAWVICLLVIFAAVIAEPVESRRKYLDYGVITKCAGPNPPPGCYPPGAQQKNPTPANEYRQYGPTKTKLYYIEYGAINKCAGPNPPPGCNPPGAEQKNPTPVNEYSRGCSKIHRCRRD
ncbi:putative rapid ALkalinization Factor [Arabidopsis thaliana]